MHIPPLACTVLKPSRPRSWNREVSQAQPPRRFLLCRSFTGAVVYKLKFIEPLARI